MQNKVKRKLSSLFSGELTAAALFAALWLWYALGVGWARPYLTPASAVYAFAVLEFILLQGSLYWYLKLRQVRRGVYRRLPEGQLRIFRILRRLNAGLLVVGLLWLVELIRVDAAQLIWYVFLYAFALVEYVNYYHVRLSYMSVEELRELIRQRGFRSSKLAKELKRR